MCLGFLLNIVLILSTTKKVIELSFCSRFKIYVSMVSMLVFTFKFIRPITIFIIILLFYRHIIITVTITFSTISFSPVKKYVDSLKVFPRSMDFSTVKDFFQNCENFPHSRDFSTVKSFLQTKIKRFL